jgi:hypothetical protein
MWHRSHARHHCLWLNVYACPSLGESKELSTLTMHSVQVNRQALYEPSSPMPELDESTSEESLLLHTRSQQRTLFYCVRFSFWLKIGQP